MPRKSRISPEDLETFQNAMKGVKPLKAKKPRVAPTAPAPRRRKPKPAFSEDDREACTVRLNESDNRDIVPGEANLLYKQDGISHKTLRNLTKGQYNVQALLDLHGKTVEEARNAVTAFIQQCLLQGIRVALIIHGKGHPDQMPILKNKLNHWLRDIREVIAFSSAAPAHGGRGAMYILLKHQTLRRNSVG